MDFDECLDLSMNKILLEISDMRGQTADPNRYSRTLFMLAQLRQEYLTGLGPNQKVPDGLKPEKEVIISKILNIIDSAVEDGVLDRGKAYEWLKSSIPGVVIRGL